ncbi:MAG: hypothetical protein COB69_07925 [Phycisphaera sp.]|nr:MAG: hypothetical protein COB69_07925 [Phycisphaera sp.]
MGDSSGCKRGSLCQRTVCQHTRTVTMKTIGMMLIGLFVLAMPAFGQPNFGDVPEVAISAKASGTTFVPGQRGFLVVVLDHGDELHSWPSAEQDVLPPEIAEFAIRAQVRVEELPEFIALGPVQWPEPKPAIVPGVDGPMEALTYKGRAVAYVPFLVADDAPVGDVELKVVVELQACDDTTCFMPQFETNTVGISIAAESGGQLVDLDFEGFDATVFDRADFGESVPVGENTQSADDGEVVFTGAKFLGLVPLPAPGSPGFLFAIALAGVVGGFVLNLTPCVLPVIPIKVLTLTQHAGESRAKAAFLGVWMAIGVVAFWTALAIPVLFLKQVSDFADPSKLFGIWWLTGGIGVAIVVMAAGLMGLFNISLPQRAYMFNPKADNASGSFLYGIMTAVLGLPCFGFVVGAILPAAIASDSKLIVATVFFSMGVGMALPYLVLSAFPGLLKHVPKTGPASDLVKQVMGLLLMAAGAYFIGAGVLVLVAEMPYLAKVLHWWVAGLLVVMAGGWLVYRTVRITRKPLPVAVFGVVALLLAAAGIMVAQNQTGQAKERWEQKEAARLERIITGGYSTSSWNEFSSELFEKARADGKVVVLDFTAEWCLNCKALKAAVLNVEPVKGRLLDEDVVAFEVDLTARSAPGWEKLRELGQTGIPTLAIFGPGLPDGPWIANVYSSGQVVSAIKNAAGGGSSEVSAR